MAIERFKIYLLAISFFYLNFYIFVYILGEGDALELFYIILYPYLSFGIIYKTDPYKKNKNPTIESINLRAFTRQYGTMALLLSQPKFS